jgi:NAD+ kinase
MKLGVVANYTHRRTPEIVKNIVAWGQEKGVTLLVGQEPAEEQGIDGNFSLSDTEIRSLDALIAIGGDGTILASSRLVSGTKTPVFGINVGGLGFLTLATAENYLARLDRFRSGDYEIEERMMLEVRVDGEGDREAMVFHALNDAVISKGSFSRIVQLCLHIAGEEIGTFRADGIIISTPTGSTGYSLSAGGPILFPTMDALLVTPICPHTLGARPLVIPSDREVTVTVLSRGVDLTLTMDGQKGTLLKGGSRILMKKAGRSTRLVRLRQDSFFALLRKKLGWIAREEV